MGRGSRRGSREGDRLRKNRGKAEQGPGRSPFQGHLLSETPKCPVPMLTRQMRPQTQDPTQSPGLAMGAFPQTSPPTRPANHFPLTLAEKRETRTLTDEAVRPDAQNYRGCIQKRRLWADFSPEHDSKCLKQNISRSGPPPAG